MTKPFAFDELAARVRAHLRTPSQAESTRLRGARHRARPADRRVTRDGVEVALSSKEFDLLAYFLRHPANVLSREQILSAVWGYSHDPGTNIVEVYVSYLRRKLGRPGSPAPIVTVRSVGYRLAPNRPCALGSLSRRRSAALAALAPDAGARRVLILAFLGTFYVVYHVTDVAPARADRHRPGARGAVLRGQDLAARCRATSRGVAARGASTSPTSRSRLLERLLYAIVPGRGIVTNYPELLGQTAHDTDDTPATARAEARFSAALSAQPPGFSIQGAPDAGRVRLLRRSVAHRGRAGLADRRRRAAAAVDDALDGITRAFAIGGTLTLAAALLVGFLLAAGFVRPLRRHGPHRGARRRRRPLAADGLPRTAQRDEGPCRRLRPHARPPRGGLRPPAGVRLRRLARAAHAADGDPRPARGPGPRGEPDAAEVRRVQRLVAAEVDRMTRLTEDLLLLAHTDESRFIRREPIELEPFLAELIASAAADNRSAVADLREVPGILNADRDRVAQALRNLLRNAVEHTAPGGTIELGAARQPTVACRSGSTTTARESAGDRARAGLRPLPSCRPGA
jgi:DNA-binding winged helix-turn-helix (wHTH) protein/signal transduction histidine kinase